MNDSEDMDLTFIHFDQDESVSSCSINKQPLPDYGKTRSCAFIRISQERKYHYKKYSCTEIMQHFGLLFRI